MVWYSFCDWFLFHIAETKKDSNGKRRNCTCTVHKRQEILGVSNHNDGYNLQHPQSNTTAGGHDNKKIAVYLAVCNRLPQRVQFNSRGNTGRIITPQHGRNSENVELTRSNISYANHGI